MYLIFLVIKLSWGSICFLQMYCKQSDQQYIGSNILHEIHSSGFLAVLCYSNLLASLVELLFLDLFFYLHIATQIALLSLSL